MPKRSRNALHAEPTERILYEANVEPRPWFSPFRDAADFTYPPNWEEYIKSLSREPGDG